jgi:hypothetical protein
MVNDLGEELSPASCVYWLLRKFRSGKFKDDGFFPLNEEYNWWCMLMFKRCEEELEWLKNRI